MAQDWDTLETAARESLREAVRDGYLEVGDEPHDQIHELADGMVPVYNYNRMQVAASSQDVYGRELELASGGEDLITLAGIAIYEALTEVLWDEWSDIQDEAEEAELEADDDETEGEAE